MKESRLLAKYLYHPNGKGDFESLDDKLVPPIEFAYTVIVIGARSVNIELNESELIVYLATTTLLNKHGIVD